MRDHRGEEAPSPKAPSVENSDDAIPEEGPRHGDRRARTIGYELGPMRHPKTQRGDHDDGPGHAWAGLPVAQKPGDQPKARPISCATRVAPKRTSSCKKIVGESPPGRAAPALSDPPLTPTGVSSSFMTRHGASTKHEPPPLETDRRASASAISNPAIGSHPIADPRARIPGAHGNTHPEPNHSKSQRAPSRATTPPTDFATPSQLGSPHLAPFYPSSRPGAQPEKTTRIEPFDERWAMKLLHVDASEVASEAFAWLVDGSDAPQGRLREALSSGFWRSGQLREALSSGLWPEGRLHEALSPGLWLGGDSPAGRLAWPRAKMPLDQALLEQEPATRRRYEGRHRLDRVLVDRGRALRKAIGNCVSTPPLLTSTCPD